MCTIARFGMCNEESCGREEMVHFVDGFFAHEQSIDTHA